MMKTKISSGTKRDPFLLHGSLQVTIISITDLNLKNRRVKNNIISGKDAIDRKDSFMSRVLSSFRSVSEGL